ncbi:hypothetical protein SB724_19145 [Bacillus sp. SIMBA_031]|uniref:hypothetical protein n=1 Tax=Bacillus sp. SIMBA_031 TaxID=3085774 RepID=UPI00397D950A
MWDIIVSYTFPIFIILFLAVTCFRIFRQNKKDGKDVDKAKLFKRLAFAVVVTVIVISAISYAIINMAV